MQHLWRALAFAGAIASSQIAIPPAAAAEDCRVTVGIPGNPPFTDLRDDEIGGIIAAATVEALRVMGCDVTPRALPFARMYKWVHEGKIDVATSVLQTPERASLAYYTRPIVTEYTLVMYRRHNTAPPKQIQDLGRLRVGAMIGFKYPTIDKSDIQLLRERDYETVIRGLLEQRFDAVLIGSITGPYLVTKSGLEELVSYMSTAINKVPLGVALSKKKFGAKDAARFDGEIEKIMASRKWQEILHEYGVEKFVNAWPVAGQ